MQPFSRYNYVPAFWYLSNNFGDSLTHYLIRKLSGKIPVWLDKDDPCLKIMATGSILNNEVENAIVWGCGVAWSNDEIPPKHKILAVRGKLTGNLCKEQGIEFDEVYGDPAMILPRIYTPKPTARRYKLGILPHYIDTKIVCDRFGVGNERLDEHSIKIINVLDDVEAVIDVINSCDKIISSTLHGLITAHAYGVPAQWVKFSNNIAGDDFKYHDYYSLTNTPTATYTDYRDTFTLNQAIELANQPMQKTTIKADVDALYNCCPFLE